MKIVTVVGARPQFIKAAALSRELRKAHREVLVHTGQHYDYGMSGIFFEQLGMPEPDVNLGVGSGLHGAQTGAMLAGIEQVLLVERPDWVVVFGDTNSTLAGALAAAKLLIPVVHVEAGLRSYNRSMPEELNRIVADHLSTLLLCPSNTAVTNLAQEGISQGVHLVGDIMSDALARISALTDHKMPVIAAQLGLQPGDYLLATVHRSENTDNCERLTELLDAFNALDEPIVFPAHPRTRKAMQAVGSALRAHVKVIDPLGYEDMIALARSARAILTDSGGLQKEAYWLGTPCITLRDETEWVETVELGWNTLAGASCERIVQAVRSIARPSSRPPLYGDGDVARRCVAVIEHGALPRHWQSGSQNGAAELAAPSKGVM